MSGTIGVNNIARNIVNGYVGVNGIARQIVNGYVGVNGIARQIWKNQEGEIGTDWFIQDFGGASLTSVCYGNGLFVAVGYSDDAIETPVLTSTNGIDWIRQPSVSNMTFLNSVCYGNGKFVAINRSRYSMISTDGINWTRNTISSTSNTNFTSVCYGNGMFIAVGNKLSVDEPTTDVIYITSDGINWTPITNIPTNFGDKYITDFTSVCYGNGMFVAVGQSVSASPNIIISSDGINWNKPPDHSTSSLQSVCYGNGMFVTVGQGGSINTRIMTSSDGNNWITRNSPISPITNMPINNAWQSVCYGNGLFVAVAENIGENNEQIMISSDGGINWTLQKSPKDYAWQSVCYGNRMFVAVANWPKGTTATDQIMTSPNGI